MLVFESLVQQVRHLVLSPLVRKLADERNAPPLLNPGDQPSRRCEHEAGAVFEATYACLATFCSAPFLAHLLNEKVELLELPRDEARRAANAVPLYELICEAEGDFAAKQYLEEHPGASESRLRKEAMAYRDAFLGPALRYDRFVSSRSLEPGHLQTHRLLTCFWRPCADRACTTCRVPR